jgi:hypothetical protein
MTPSRRSILTFAIGAIFIILSPPLAIAQSAGSTALPARSNSDGGVQVVVKPKIIAAGSAWEFDVTMSTHTTPLTNDLSKTAVLIDGGGRRYQPLSWQGDPPGGHHRKGVLRFPEPATQAKSFEIQIQGVGVSTRVFQWTMR